MLRKILKTAGNCLLALLLFCLMGIVVLASAEEIDLKRTGSITITPKDISGVKDTVSGMAFNLYKAADIVNNNGEIKYQLTEDFAGSEAELDNLNSASALAAELAEYVNNKSLTALSVGTDDSGTGKIVFSNLSTGLYLLIQNTEKDTSGYAVSPFLVSVPNKKDGSEDWIYDVEGSPKAEITPSATPTPTPTPAPTATPTATPTVTPVVTPTDTPAVTPSATPTATPVPGSSETPTPSLTPSPSETPVPSTTPAPSETPIPSATPAPTETPAPTPSVTPEVSPTPSVTPGITPSATPEVTPSATPGATVTPTPPTYNNSTPTPTPPAKLAQTGQLNWPIPVLAVAGLLLFAVGWGLVNLKKK